MKVHFQTTPAFPGLFRADPGSIEFRRGRASSICSRSVNNKRLILSKSNFVFKLFHLLFVHDQVLVHALRIPPRSSVRLGHGRGLCMLASWLRRRRIFAYIISCGSCRGIRVGCGKEPGVQGGGMRAQSRGMAKVARMKIPWGRIGATPRSSRNHARRCKNVPPYTPLAYVMISNGSALIGVCEAHKKNLYQGGGERSAITFPRSPIDRKHRVSHDRRLCGAR